jgi:hypothetical protein
LVEQTDRVHLLDGHPDVGTDVLMKQIDILGSFLFSLDGGKTMASKSEQ